MARIKMSSLFSEVSGSLGNVTFQKSKSSLIMRNKPRNTRTRTVSQFSALNYMRLAQAAYKVLTAANIKLISQYIIYNNVKIKKDTNVLITARQLFLKWCFYILQSAEAFVFGVVFDPSYFIYGYPLVTSLGGVGLVLTPNSAQADPDYFFAIYISSPQPPGTVCIPSRCRYIPITKSTDSTFDIAQAYLDIYGNLPLSGQNLYYRIVSFRYSTPAISHVLQGILTVLDPELLLTFNDISEATALIGADITDFANWNTYFGGAIFTSVQVSGNAVNLKGGSAISLPSDLYLSANKPIDIHDYTGCVTILDLNGTAITDPPVLTGLTAIRILNLASTAITDPPVLTGLTALVELFLANTDITDPPVLTGLTALQCLYLNDTAITDPPVLTGLTALVELILTNTAITDPPVLTGLTALVELILANTVITDPPVLTGLTALQYLYLNDTAITDPPVLTGLTALVMLYLNDNPGLNLADIDAILTEFAILFPALLYVDLKQNPDIVPTPATLATAAAANPLCTFNVDV